MPDLIDLSVMESVPVVVDGFERLRRHWEAPNEAFWEDVWERTGTEDYMASAQHGNALGEYEQLYRRFLPSGGRVLEAGCGLGQVTMGLRKLGYDACGLDWAAGTIDFLRRHFPAVPFRQGDIRSLPYPDGSFDGYISLGVIEHFTSGQGGILREANRVLRPGGSVFLSVPYYNGYRQLRARRGRYVERASAAFFEDCYTEEELHDLLRRAGFCPVVEHFANPVMTFAQESAVRPLYRRIEDVRYVRGAVDRVLRRVLPRRWFGHMIMVVATKDTPTSGV